MKIVFSKTVNIVFTTDTKYKEYLKVAIKSAIVNKNKDSVYNIIILAPFHRHESHEPCISPKPLVSTESVYDHYRQSLDRGKRR